MAGFDSESYHQSDAFSPRHPSGPSFGIPNFFIGFSTKNSSDTDSARSPTSPLDIVFSSLKNPFGFRSQKSSSHAESKKILDCTKVGLGIINSLADGSQAIGQVVDAPEKKYIIFRPQVKKTDIPDCSSHYYELLNSSMESDFLPRNYMTPWVSQTRIPNSEGSSNIADGIEGVLVTPKPIKDIVSSWLDSRPASFSQNPNLGLKNFTSENRTVIMSLPKVIDRCTHVKSSLVSKPRSLPVSIGSGHNYATSLSAREIELSEDYTCVICHGPNPKTTHIFGDCILECHTDELSNFAKKEGQGIGLPQVARRPEGSAPFPSDELLSFCYSCKNELKEGEDIYIYRGEKAFCSLECRSEVIFAEEETERSYNNSSGGSPGSSSHEDLFLMGFQGTT